MHLVNHKALRLAIARDLRQPRRHGVTFVVVAHVDRMRSVIRDDRRGLTPVSLPSTVTAPSHS